MLYSEYEFVELAPDDWIARRAGQVVARGTQTEVVTHILDASAEQPIPRHRPGRAPGPVRKEERNVV